MKQNFAQRHPDWFAMSVYEDPENLIPVFNRIGIFSLVITVALNAGAGYLLSEYRSAPWARDLVAFVLGLSDAFATRFNDLQGLTQTGGYYYVGSMVVSLVAAVMMSILFITTYVQITLRRRRALPFNMSNLKGLMAVGLAATFAAYVSFFAKMETGPYLGMSRIFLPGAFPVVAFGGVFFVPLAIVQAVVFVIKYFRCGGEIDE